MSMLNEQVESVARTATKLLNEVERLRRDVIRLWGRIEPFEDEKHIPAIDEIRPRIRNLPDCLNVIAEARESIRSCEHDLGAIRARIDSIEADAISREELKPYIRERKRDGR